MSAASESPFAAFGPSSGRAQTAQHTALQRRPQTSAGPASARSAKSSRSEKARTPRASTSKSSRPARVRTSPSRSPHSRGVPENEIQELKDQTLGSLPSLRMSVSRGNSPSRSMSMSLGGYKPPAGSAAVDDEAKAEANRLISEEAELIQLLQNEVFIFAAHKCGVTIDELTPRPVEYFRPAPAVSLRRATMDKAHYDKMRAHYLGLVLMSLEEAAEELAVRELEQSQLQENKFEGFQRSLTEEQERLRMIERNRQRIQDVQIRENEKFKQTRIMFEESQREFAKREREAEEKKKAEVQKLRERAKVRAAQLEKVRVTKEQREKERIQSILQKEQEREAAKEALRAQRAAEQAKKEEERQARRRARDAKRQQAREREERRKQQLLAEMREKERLLEESRMARVAELEAKKDERYIKSKLRAKNAERVRKEKEFKFQQMMTKIQRSYEKMEHLAEMREAIQEERRRQKAMEIIRVDEWKAKTKLEKDVTPGPGEYKVPTTIGQQGGGTWGKHKPKSELEWQMIRAAQTPGPGQYRIKKQDIIPGGTWGTYHAKSDLEWKIYHASRMPGPSDYRPPPVVGKDKGVAFSTTQTPTAIEELMRRKAQEPGPTDYGVANMPKERVTLSKLQEKVERGKRKIRALGKLAALSKGFGGSLPGLAMSPIRRPMSSASAADAVGTPSDSDRRQVVSAGAGDAVSSMLDADTSSEDKQGESTVTDQQPEFASDGDAAEPPAAGPDPEPQVAQGGDDPAQAGTTEATGGVDTGVQDSEADAVASTEESEQQNAAEAVAATSGANGGGSDQPPAVEPEAGEQVNADSGTEHAPSAEQAGAADAGTEAAPSENAEQ